VIRRLDWIKNCCNFNDFRWDGSLPELKQINIIDGPSGSCKTGLLNV
jgi:hypothetical protein